MKLKTLVVGALSLVLIAPVSFVEAASDTLQQLKEGGYVVLIRHTDAFQGKDRDVSNLIDCRKQRNMSFQGMEDAF